MASPVVLCLLLAWGVQGDRHSYSPAPEVSCTACDHHVQTLADARRELMHQLPNATCPDVSPQSCRLLTAQIIHEALSPAAVFKSLVCPEACLPRAGLGDASDCAMCIFIAMQMDDALPPSPSRDQIEQALDDACQALGPSARPACLTFVRAHGSDMVQQILGGTPIDQLCTVLKICTGQPLENEAEHTATLCALLPVVSGALPAAVRSARTLECSGNMCHHAAGTVAARLRQRLSTPCH